jgi:hypothetical protein
VHWWEGEALRKEQGMILLQLMPSKMTHSQIVESELLKVGRSHGLGWTSYPGNVFCRISAPCHGMKESKSFSHEFLYEIKLYISPKTNLHIGGWDLPSPSFARLVRSFWSSSWLSPPTSWRKYSFSKSLNSRMLVCLRIL